MVFIFSGAITKNNLDSFLLVRKETLIKQNEGAFTFCFSRVDFIDPIGICLLASLFEDITDKNIAISLINLKLNIESYLTRMSFFTHFNKINYLDNTSHYRKNDKSKDLIELRKISEINKVSGVSAQLSKVVLGQIPDISNDDDPDGMIASETERLSDNLEYVFGEILSNAVDHGKKRGFEFCQAHIAAQYYKKTNILVVAIVDNGCGLLETLSSNAAMNSEFTHKKALEIALLPRVSCNRDGEYGLDTKNQGIGLTVSTEMALQARGEFTIFSGNALVRRSFSSANLTFQALADWNGVGVVLEFDRRYLPDLAKSEIIQNLPGFEVVSLISFE